MSLDIAQQYSQKSVGGERRGLYATDLILGVLIALVAAWGTWNLANELPKSLLDPRNPDIYFSSDASRVHANMASRDSNHFRTSVHPLFSIITHPVFISVAAVMRVDYQNDPLNAGAIYVSKVISASVAACAMGLFYALLRTVGLARLDTAIFSSLAGVSAFSLFWFPVPETYPWGAVSIIAGLLVAAIGSRMRLPILVYAVGSIVTLAITTTNWMVGMIAMWSRFDWRRTALWTAAALAVAVTLSLAQKVIFPSSGLFIRPRGEQAYVLQHQSGGPIRCMVSFLVHTVIMPEVTREPHARVSGQTVLRIQNSAPASNAGFKGVVAIACWMLLLLAGVYALFSVPDLVPIRITLGLSLLGQFALHLIYGAETFLYAAHYGPMLIALAAFAALSRLRPLVLAAAVVLAACLVPINLTEFNKTKGLIIENEIRLKDLPR